MVIALIGDYNENVLAHRAIPLALELASEVEEVRSKFEWLHSDKIDIGKLSGYSAVWCVPGSPYSNMENVLSAIEYVRTNDIPFLGTCGGFQHAALEFARNALGHSEAENAEVNPTTKMPLISGLSCELRGVKNRIRLVGSGIVRRIYGVEEIEEEYNCGYGVNKGYLPLFEGSDLSFTGFDQGGDPRVLEIGNRRFFVGTAYQPERSVFSNRPHPLIRHFVKVADSDTL